MRPHRRFTFATRRLRESASQPRHRVTPGALAALLVVLAVLAAACSSAGSSSAGAPANSTGGSAAGSSNPIVLGISVPLSGAVGSSCGPMNQAMVAWFNHVNATGGVNGAQLKVDTRDDAYEAAEAVTNTRAFVAEHAVAVTGQCGSIQPPAQLPILQAASIPYLFVFGSCDTCTSDSMYFNLMPDYGVQLAEEIPWVFQHKGTGSVVIMTSATPGAAAITSNVENAVKQAGGKFLASYSTPPGTADMTPFVLKMKALNPDYVVLNMTPQDAAVLTKAMSAENFAPTKDLIGSAAISQATYLSNVSPSLYPKVIVSSDVIPPSAAGSTQCAAVLKKAGIAVSGVTLRGCGTAQVVVAALKQTKGPVTSAGVVSAIEGWTNEKASEIYPPISFTKSNHIGVSSLYLFGVKNGQFVVIGQLS
jgi:branched-chain amino acid transport system substrate-binding protein